jgi:hypothetical protein
MSQTKFDNYVSAMPHSETKYSFNENLEGPIDLSIFETEKRNPIILNFAEGSITHLLNVPNSIRVLQINNNLLDALPLLRDLNIIMCNNNRITQFECENYDNLEELRISGNQLIELVELPPKLKVLEIDNNTELTTLDLGNAPDLMNVSCVHNKKLRKITNVCQEKNHGFVFNHDSNVNIKYIEKCSKKEKKVVDSEDAIENTLDYYYRLKNKYEKERSTKVHSIIAMPIPKKDKKKLLRGIPKKCINCGKTGGTLFWRKSDMLHAECGATPKCNLRLTVPVGFYSNIYDLIKLTEDDMQEKRANIIRLKMDTLFSYITETESTKRFKNDLEVYQSDEAMHNTYKAYEENIVNDPVKAQLIKKKSHEIYKILKEVRVSMEEYNKTGDQQILRDAVDKQVGELRSELDGLRDLRFPVMEMIVDDDDVKHLYQSGYKMNLLDYRLVNPSASDVVMNTDVEF